MTSTFLHQASYDSADEAMMAAGSYIRALHPRLSALVRKDAALESAPELAYSLSFSRHTNSQVCGVGAIASGNQSASEIIRPSIRRLFRESIILPAHFRSYVAS